MSHDHFHGKCQSAALDKMMSSLPKLATFPGQVDTQHTKSEENVERSLLG